MTIGLVKKGSVKIRSMYTPIYKDYSELHDLYEKYVHARDDVEYIVIYHGPQLWFVDKVNEHFVEAMSEMKGSSCIHRDSKYMVGIFKTSVLNTKGRKDLELLKKMSKDLRY